MVALSRLKGRATVVMSGAQTVRRRSRREGLHHGHVQRSACLPCPGGLTGLGRNERRVLPASACSVSAGREFVRDVILSWRLDAFLDDATQVTSELMANAVAHGRTAFVVEMSIDLDSRELVIAVTDFGTRPVLDPITAWGLRSLMEEPDLRAESGRGLLIVATLSDRWGITPDPPGKTVWCALSLVRRSIMPVPRRASTP